MRKTLLALALVASGCITKGEYQADVKAWRAYYDATKDDLQGQYDVLPEPVRSTRLVLVKDEEKTIRTAEVRAGLVDPAFAPVGSG